MTIRVALHHRTRYEYDRLVALSPHEIRLRPAAHARTPIDAYSLKIAPAHHFLNWQQDPYGNWIARVVFPDPTRELAIDVDLVADLTVINPFDFFVAKSAEQFPFTYSDEERRELAAYLEIEPAGPRLAAWTDGMRAKLLASPIATIDFLVGVNRALAHDIRYLIRMEPGIQTCEQTLERAAGSCRDSAWLLVQILRRCGVAARFVSGYLIQLVADVKPLEGPAGTDHDFTDLHAWCEAYIPGAGWVGLDPTSGLLAAEGHIPLACAALPMSASPVHGFADPCETKLSFEMKVTRIHEDPRVTRPLTEDAWAEVDALGQRVDRELAQHDVRLTQGGEPTFVSIDDMDGAEWNYTALSPKKYSLAIDLVQRLRARFAPGALLHFGQGKWYPGEPLPRWALSCHWRADGKPVWPREDLIAIDLPAKPPALDAVRSFVRSIAEALWLHPDYVQPAYEDPWRLMRGETQLPVNVDPLARNVKVPAERAKLVRQLQTIGEPIGFVLPLKAVARATAAEPTEWQSSLWPLRTGHIFAVAGDSPLGLRLPLDALPLEAPEDVEVVIAEDPFADKRPLGARRSKASPTGVAAPRTNAREPRAIVRTALCVEPRDGIVHVFVPPVETIEDYLSLVAAVETAAVKHAMPLRFEGYAPPRDHRLLHFGVTPDPGVIEVNIHPAAGWDELKARVLALYEEARHARLATEKFMLDGRHTGTGGGNHVTLGGATPADSPMLRRPDLLASLVRYWQNHPSLSYLFSGTFVGPTSQAPRVDEARDDALYELEIALAQLDDKARAGVADTEPWLVDRLLRHFLVDLTGNTHRAEFSIDKLYAPETATGRLGLLEFRAFEMPPHPRMSLLQMLLLRALVARFWQTPFKRRLVAWGTDLHDRFMLPHFVAQDFRDVVDDLASAGYAFRYEWFLPFFEFRFPRYGTVAYRGIELELRQAIEPWHVLGEEVSAGGMSRYVDSSLERMQVRVRGLSGKPSSERFAVMCNGRPLPLTPTGAAGEYIAGVRYKAWAPPSALHPTIDVHTPLVFDIVDLWNGRSIGGCTYHVSHPGGRNYESFPVNALEAEARRVARFFRHGHTQGDIAVRFEARNPAFPTTLDLRRPPVFDERPQGDQ